MDNGKNIVRINIEHYKRLLASETDPTSARSSIGSSLSKRPSSKRWSGRSGPTKAHFSTRASVSDGHRPASLSVVWEDERVLA
jgi:hypothetical protein